MKNRIFTFILLVATFVNLLAGEPYRVFAFSPETIPVIDGNTDDWQCVPASYSVGIDEMREDEGKHSQTDRSTLDVSLMLGWCPGLNRLYIRYEADDNYWRFTENSLSTDILEIVVDGDRSRGPFIDRFHPTAAKDVWQAWFNFHGCHAQNYHIFTPPHGADWCMLWGPQVWLKEQPWSQCAYRYNFTEGGSGHLTLECYITPFDHADAAGPHKSHPTVLQAGREIGFCFAVIDWDERPTGKDGFWNLSHEHTMYGNADYLPTWILEERKK